MFDTISAMTVRKIKRLVAFVTAILAGILWLSSQIEVLYPPDNTDDSFANVEVVVPATPAIGDLATVVRVVDGDTIVVLLAGEEKKIRMIGMNSPESVDPRKKVECFGKEASAHLSELLSGGSVVLVADATQGDVDKYGRLLRYVMLEDGTDINAAMIADGYAYEYTYDEPYERQSAYQALEREAELAERGLWSPATCHGKK